MANQKAQVIVVNTSTFPVYDSKDLSYFQTILEDVMSELRTAPPGAERPDEMELRIKVATALFHCAESGERDYALLRRHALTAVNTAPSDGA